MATTVYGETNWATAQNVPEADYSNGFGIRSGEERPKTRPGGWTHTEDWLGDFKQIRVTFNRLLETYETLNAAAAIGYALRENINGERLSLPKIAIAGEVGIGENGREGLYSVLLFNYDSEQGANRDFDVRETFRVAAEYVIDGSPLRKTDRAGNGTQNTRLVQGIGEVGVRFEVR
jgi:hypothetical protein